jgi:hypothetical protein
VQDGTSDGRYRLLECIGRNDKGETWRAFDNVTQREVAVTVLADAGGDTVTVLADDGGDTVAKELPQWAAGSAPALDYPSRRSPRTGFDNVHPGSGVKCPSQAYDETYTRTGD